MCDLNLILRWSEVLAKNVVGGDCDLLDGVDARGVVGASDTDVVVGPSLH